MSLLMDALKKAEEEKKRAAKQLEQVEGRTSLEDTIHEKPGEKSVSEAEENKATKNNFLETVELSLEPFEPASSRFEETMDADPAKQQSISQREVPTVDASESFSEGLTLENTIHDESADKTQEAIDLNDTTIIEGLSTENSSAPFDDTFHGVLFEEDDKNTVSYEETLPGIPAEQLIKDLGGGKYQPTPVAAQTVFSAGRTKSNTSSFKWGAVVVLAILAVGSFAVFYYFTITPVVRKLPSPIVARGIESTLIPPPPQFNSMNQAESVVNEKVEQVTDSGTETVAQQPSEAVEMSVSEMEVSQNEIPIQETQESIIDNADVNISSENLELPKTNNIIADTQEAEKPGVIVDEVKQEKLMQEEIVPETGYIQPNLGLVSISKKVIPKKSSVMVNEAFKAYKENQFDVAKSLYQDAVKNEPDNRDAHLGLAAIAIKNRNYQSAYEHYLHVLNLNPEDVLARNALINLTNNSIPINNESTIKTLLQKEGDAPYLYFSLGNVYARQLRWPEAQEAFFEAYRLDTTNADYVLNLAISLDQIGQFASAYDYYKTAIELAQGSSAEFDYVSVNNRITALSNIISSKP